MFYLLKSKSMFRDLNYHVTRSKIGSKNYKLKSKKAKILPVQHQATLLPSQKVIKANFLNRQLDHLKKANNLALK